MQRWAFVLVMVSFLLKIAMASPPGGFPRQLPKANEEATEKLKAAYAAYVQGHYRKAIRLALEVYWEHGDVEAKWFPSWVAKVVKGPIPDPYNQGEVLSRTIKGSFLFTTAIQSTFPSYLLARSYLACGEHKEVEKWLGNLRKLGWEYDGIVRVLTFPHPCGYGEVHSPKNTWHPLPLRFREEDYFILVPLDEACKVLGLSFRYKVDPKTGKRTGAQIGEKGLISLMGRPFARNIKGEVDDMAYAPFEENGVAWVPFYWLAKQAGIRGWEVRNGKIYVAPK